MTKTEIIKLYISDLKNFESNSLAIKNRIVMLQKELEIIEPVNTNLIKVLKRYEQWEANMILEPRCWENTYPELTEELYEELLEIQKLRNEAWPF